MSPPGPTEPDEQPPRPRGSDFGLPSWVDAAITRSRDEQSATPVAEPAPEIVLEPVDIEPVRDASEESPAATPTAPTPSLAPASRLQDATTPRRPGVLPWILSAVLFAAAAAVMAYMMWFKPTR